MSQQNQHRTLKDKRTKNLTRRLKPGDIALIHHSDLDTTAARVLVECKVAAVFNAVPSISGRYPNRGPELLIKAGIPLIDNVGEAAFDRVIDGAFATLSEMSLDFADGFCLTGELQTKESVAQQMQAARANLGVELDHFARNTLGYLNNEQNLLFDAVDVPAIKTKFTDRHVLIVVRGEGYKEDLAMLSDYLRDVRPALVAVDGGADALLEVKLKPDIILGDMDSVSDAALHCGAELIVQGYGAKDSRGAPGMTRIEELGLKAIIFHSPGTSEDVAMLMADALGAKLIVAVGTHFSLEDFLDKGRGGMASTFLTRLRIGSKLVDAKGIARLWTQTRPRFSEIALVAFAAITSIIAVLTLSPTGQLAIQWVGIWFQHKLHRGR